MDIKINKTICHVSLRDISDSEYSQKKPEWCPLQELPEKKWRGLGEYGEKMFRAGFNACLDEILAGRKE